MLLGPRDGRRHLRPDLHLRPRPHLHRQHDLLPTCAPGLGPTELGAAFESIWDVNNNGWELAWIVTFVLIMSVFIVLICCYCFCDRCIFNRRKYAAERERKE